MRALLAVLAVLLVSGLGFWWSQRDDTAPPPPGNGAPELPSPDAPDGPATGGVREQATPVPPPVEPTEPQPAVDEPPPAEAAVPDPRAPLLTVVDVTTQQPVPEFRWRFVLARETLRGDSADNPAALPLPEGAVGDLLVEADGRQPFHKKGVRVPTASEPRLMLTAQLVPVPSTLGVTLVVTDDQLALTPHVRVDAFEITDDNRGLAWQLGKPLWARLAEAADGSYELPPLPVGEFGVQLVATTPDGAPRPLQPFRRTFQLTGSNGFLEHVALEPGCALRLDLREPNGEAFDPSVHGAVTITLNAIGEQGVQRRWSCRDQDGAGTRTELDRVPGPSPVWLPEPVAPGAYVLEIFVNGDPRVRQPLQLRAEQQTERVTVL